MNVTITHYTTSQSGGAYWFWLFFSWKGAYWIRYNVGINLFWDLDFHILEPIEVSNCILFKFDNVNFGKPCFFFLSILQSYLDAVGAWFWLLLLGCYVTQMVLLYMLVTHCWLWNQSNMYFVCYQRNNVCCWCFLSLKLTLPSDIIWYMSSHFTPLTNLQ